MREIRWRLPRAARLSVVAAAALTALLASAAPAHAATTAADGWPRCATYQFPLDAREEYGCNRSVATHPEFSGWGATVGFGACSTRYVVVAWMWTGSTWSRASLNGATRVYVYPFADGWKWAWTPPTGWIAVRSKNLVINPGSTGQSACAQPTSGPVVWLD